MGTSSCGISRQATRLGANQLTESDCGRDPGDVLTVTRIDRLACGTFLFGVIKRIVEAKAQFRSLVEPWADAGTSTGTGRLMLGILGGLAEVERDIIRTRTAEGRTRAKGARKVHGPPP